MQIDDNILITYGAVSYRVNKGEFIFHEGTTPIFYYQVVEGCIKVFTSNTKGKEFIQGIFSNGQSFGEPPLLINKLYPSSAQATAASVVIKISREKLLDIFNDYPQILQNLFFKFADRLYQKSISAQIWVSRTPEEKIIQFLENIKTYNNHKAQEMVSFTRQQIADFTGLRVETVIRTLSRLSQHGKVKIIDHKLYY